MKNSTQQTLKPVIPFHVKIVLLIWMLCITFLDWLMYGAGLGFLSRMLVKLQLLAESLRQFFTAPPGF